MLFYVDGIFYLDVAFSIENRMNARAFRDIWARVMFLNFKSITSDHISRNARAIIRFFVYNILNKIIEESIFGTYFSVKHLQLFIEIFVLVLLQFRVEFSFICPFSQIFFHVLILSCFCFLH